MLIQNSRSNICLIKVSSLLDCHPWTYGSILARLSRTAELETASLVSCVLHHKGKKKKKLFFWVEIRKLVNEVGISNYYTGRHLAVQLSICLAVWSIIIPMFSEACCTLHSCLTNLFWFCLPSQIWKVYLIVGIHLVGSLAASSWSGCCRLDLYFADVCSSSWASLEQQFLHRLWYLGWQGAEDSGSVPDLSVGWDTIVSVLHDCKNK